MQADTVGSGIETIKANYWGTGFIATFEYIIGEDDVRDDLVRDWRIEIDYTGDADLHNAWMAGYAGSITSGYVAPPTCQPDPRQSLPGIT